jgi:hypothetical protein
VFKEYSNLEDYPIEKNIEVRINSEKDDEWKKVAKIKDKILDEFGGRKKTSFSVLEELREVHRKGILHLDIKP